jgi:hypothetical protein
MRVMVFVKATKESEEASIREKFGLKLRKEKGQL